MAATATARASARAKRAAGRPPRRAAAAAKRRRSGHTPIGGFVPVAAAAGAVGGIADSRPVVWLTRGRLWIGLLGSLLVGIVGLNVIALGFSASSSTAGQATDALRRENSALRARIAGELSNSEIQSAAASLGLVMPAAGAFHYLDASTDDAVAAARRLRRGELSAGAVTTVAPPAIDPATAAAPSTDADAAQAVDPALPEAAPPATAADPVEAAPAAAAPAPTTTSGGAVGAP